MSDRHSKQPPDESALAAWWQVLEQGHAQTPDPRWFAALVPEVRRHIARCLGHPMVEFAHRILIPGLSRRDSAGKRTTYISVQDSFEARGKHHLHADSLAADPVELVLARLIGFCAFTNPLRFGDWHPGPQGTVYDERPMDRVTLAGPHIFTFEIDQPGLKNLERQFKWCLPGPWSKRWSQSTMGKLYQNLSQFDDFVGLTACWSGNKSVHLHAVFDTEMISRYLPAGVNIRTGLAEHWCRLAGIVARHVGEAGFDTRLRFPEQYRRLPGGGRVVGEVNALGIPAGTIVPQLVI